MNDWCLECDDIPERICYLKHEVLNDEGDVF